METVSISKYNPGWTRLFSEEAERIRNAFTDTHPDIQHIGSTAVPGLDAKPVIDIILGFKKLDAPHIIERMTVLGYKHWTEDTFQHVRLMFTKWERNKRLVNVHATVKGNLFWNEQIRFRDLLRTNADLCREYGEMKKSLATRYHDDPEGYTAAKTDFVRKALAT